MLQNDTMLQNDNLPCIDIQDTAIIRAAGAFYPLPEPGEPDEPRRTEAATCQYLGDHDPDKYRTWQANGSLAKVIFFDKGNGWADIEEVETPNPLDRQKFVDELWNQVLHDNHLQSYQRDKVAKMTRHCPKGQDCHCAARLQAATQK